MPGGVRWCRPRSGVWFEPRGAPTVSGADACVVGLYSAAAATGSSIRSRVRAVSSLMPGPIVEAMVIERM